MQKVILPYFIGYPPTPLFWKNKGRFALNITIFEHKETKYSYCPVTLNVKVNV